MGPEVEQEGKQAEGRSHGQRPAGRPATLPFEQRRREGSTTAPRRDKREEDKGGVLGEYGLSEEQGNEIIMAARAHWFDDEPATEEAADADSSQ